MLTHNNGFIKVQGEYGDKLIKVLIKHKLLPEKIAEEKRGEGCIVSDGSMLDISIEEQFCQGDIEDALRLAVEELAQENICPYGRIEYYGDYEGRYDIEDGTVTTLSREECFVRDMTDEEVIAEAERRKLTVIRNDNITENTGNVSDEGKENIEGRLIVRTRDSIKMVITLRKHGVLKADTAVSDVYEQNAALVPDYVLKLNAENCDAGRIGTSLRTAITELAEECGIFPKGMVACGDRGDADCYTMYEIPGNGKVIALTYGDCFLRDRTDESILCEARRRGFRITRGLIYLFEGKCGEFATTDFEQAVYYIETCIENGKGLHYGEDSPKDQVKHFLDDIAGYRAGRIKLNQINGRLGGGRLRILHDERM